MRGSRQSAQQAGTRDTPHGSALRRPAADVATAGRLGVSLSDTPEADNNPGRVPFASDPPNGCNGSRAVTGSGGWYYTKVLKPDETVKVVGRLD